MKKLSVLLGLGAQNNNSPLIPGTSGNSNYAYGGACAISNGSATQLLGLNRNYKVIIRFGKAI